MICSFIHHIVASRTDSKAYIFFTPGFVGCRNFIFRENCFEGAFRDTGAAVDAGLWVNIIPGPFLLGFPRHNTLNRTNFNAASVTKAQACDDIGH
jgi:hypothetical protein